MTTNFFAKKLTRLPSGLAAAVTVLILLFASACSSGDDGYSGEPEKLVLGMEATAVNSLIYIAESQGYFQENGIELTIREDYLSGAAAVEGVLRGEVDIATGAELAIVRQAFAGQEIRSLGNIDTFMHMQLIGNQERGISDVADLRGKTIGVPLKSSAEFNLGRFLDLNKIGLDEVTIVDVQAPQAVDALMTGQVDAVVAWQPNVATLKTGMGDKASIWSVQNGQPLYCALISSNSLIVENPELVGRFLKAVVQAEEFVLNDPDQAKGIIQSRLGYSDAYMEEIWPEHNLSLTLDQSFILAMEDQARWMIGKQLTDETTVPDFVDYIYQDGMRQIKPEAVQLID